PSDIAAMNLDKTLDELNEAEGEYPATIQTTQPPTFNLAEVEGLNLGPSLDVYGEPTTATTEPNEVMPTVNLSAIEGVSLDKVLLYPEVTTTAAPEAGTTSADEAVQGSNGVNNTGLLVAILVLLLLLIVSSWCQFGLLVRRLGKEHAEAEARSRPQSSRAGGSTSLFNTSGEVTSLPAWVSSDALVVE
ncbi:hypothetical protein FOZ63_006828, partial [Perkinsus olseni]